MANRQSRKRLFTPDEVYDTFFTAGSGEEDDDSNDLDDVLGYEEELDLFQDVVRPLDLVVSNEAARSDTSRASSSTLSDVDQSRSTNDTPTQLSYDASPESNANEEENDMGDIIDPYMADTEVEEDIDEDEQGLDLDLDLDQQPDEDVNEWVKNTRNFPRIPAFTGQPGLKIDLPEDPSALDIYKLIITEDLLRSWKSETNHYARTIINSKDPQLLSNRSRFKTWKPVTLDEMRKFIAICLHMGLLPKPTLKDYWTWHVSLHSSFCFNVMERDRFLSILSFFHIADNSTFVPFGRPDHDPIHKIRPFVDHLNRVFKELYEPDREICIDEAMVPFKGRSKFKVYMKDKPTKWGFKLYELCESKTGYVYTLEVYCADKRLSNKAVDVTMRLMHPLLEKGYHLYVDNYYCCPELWERLKNSHTALVGTCRKNRIGMPRDLFEVRQSAGELDYRRKGQIIATRWMDKSEVVTLSSCHLPQLRETIGRFEVKEKPLSVIDYVKFMSGVDHSDQLISFFPMRRKQQKWWKKPFFHLLTLASIQTMILLNVHRKQHRRRTVTLSQVVKELIVSLASVENTTVEAEDVVHLPLNRLKEKHFIEACPLNEAGDRKVRRQCKVCCDRAKSRGMLAAERKKNRVLTTFWCPKCKVGLCLSPCFEIYHTKQDYTAQ